MGTRPRDTSSARSPANPFSVISPSPGRNDWVYRELRTVLHRSTRWPVVPEKRVSSRH
jgi:hypothetical protein